MAAKRKPVLNGAGTHVWLRNPDNGALWECPVDVASVFVDARGWEYADAPDRSLDGLFDEATADGANQTGFNPAEHTVDEVNAHLAEHAASAPGEVERVLLLERAGRDRTTVVDPRVDEDADDSDGDPTGD